MGRPFAFIIIGVLAVVVAGCGINDTARLIEAGNKYFDSGQFERASIVYRTAISKDALAGEAYYRLGLTWLRLGRYADAVRAFRRASELQPENNDAHSKLGDLYLSIYLSDPARNKNLLADFEELSGRLLSRDPKSYEALRMQGLLHAANKNFKLAIEALRAADQVKPGQPDLTLSLAQTLAADGQEQEAETLASNHIASNPTYAPMYDFLYMQKWNDAKPAEAEQVLKKKVANNPKSVIFRLELAAHYLRRQQTDLMTSTLGEITSNPADFPDGRGVVGDYYLRIGQPNEALRQYQAGVLESPEMKLPLEKRVAELLAATGRVSEAVEMVERLAREHPNDAEVKAVRASLRLRSGDPQAASTAVAEMEGLLNDLPSNPVVRFNLGEALMAKGETEKAIVQFEEAVRLRPTYIPPRFALGSIYLARRDYPRSLQFADSILQLNPAYIPGRLLRASSQIGLADYSSARRELDQLLQAQPDMGDALYLRSQLEVAQKRYPQAEAALRSLLAANPGDLRGLFGLADVMIETNRGDAALQLLENELKKDPQSRILRLARANVLMQVQKHDTAIAEFTRLVEEQPNSEDLRMRLAEAHRRAGNYEQALAGFESVRKLNPRNMVARLGIASVYQLTGRESEIRKIYEEIVQIDPNHAVALNNLAFLLADAGTDLDQALSYAQRAKKLLPNNLDVADTLGWVYIRKNLSDDAIRIFHDLLAKQPGHVSWRYHLAMALFQKGDRLQARRELQTALKNGPTKEETRKIQELLDRIG